MKTGLKRFAYLAVRVVQLAFWMLAAAAYFLARLPIELIRLRPRAAIRAAAARPDLEAAMRPLKPTSQTTSPEAEAAGEEVSSGRSP